MYHATAPIKLNILTLHFHLTNSPIIILKIFNPFLASVVSVPPENLWFSDVFRGCRNGALAWNGFIGCELRIFALQKKMKFSIKGFSSKCDQIRSFPRIQSHLLMKSLTKNFIFCAGSFTWKWIPCQSTNYINMKKLAENMVETILNLEALTK